MNIFKINTQRLYFTELSTLIDSKVNIISAVKIMAENIGNKKLQPVCTEINELISQGVNLSDCLNRFPDIFTPWQISIVRYSEKAGRIAEGLQRIIIYLDRDYAIQRRLLIGFLYPFFLLNLALFFIPVSVFTSSGPALYFLTVFKYFLILYAGAALLFFSKKIFSFFNMGSVYDSIWLNLPVLGKINRQFLLISFIRSLESLTKSGVNIIQAWKISAENVSNFHIKQDLLKGLFPIENGLQLKAAFQKTNLFSGKVIGMITAGEAGGSIAKMLSNIADFYERDNELITSALSKIIPVLFYLAVAGIIAVRIILFYISYFNQVFSF